MYAALWRVLPGPWWVRTLMLAVALAAVLSALVLWVFPWADQFVAPQDVTVSQ
jgi:predicted membrane protein